MAALTSYGQNGKVRRGSCAFARGDPVRQEPGGSILSDTVPSDSSRHVVPPPPLVTRPRTRRGQTVPGRGLASREACWDPPAPAPPVSRLGQFCPLPPFRSSYPAPLAHPRGSAGRTNVTRLRPVTDKFVRSPSGFTGRLSANLPPALYLPAPLMTPLVLVVVPPHPFGYHGQTAPLALTSHHCSRSHPAQLRTMPRVSSYFPHR